MPPALATPAVGAAALRRVAATQIGWEWLSTRFLPLAAPAERRPPIVEGLRAVMGGQPRTCSSRSVTQTLDGESTGMWSSSHPPMKRADRALRAVGRATPSSVATSASPRPTLLTGGAAAFSAIEQALTGDENPTGAVGGGRPAGGRRRRHRGG